MDDVVRDLAVLSEPVRVRLLAVLEEAELGVTELVRVLQLPQSTVSRHLKALRTAGWIRRRTVGTASLHGADLDTVDPVGQQLWNVVGDAFRATHQAREDRVRLAAALAERDEGDSFFGRVHAEWDALRRELFGDTYLAAALAALLPADWTVADLGCGTGEILALLAPGVHRVIGVDREPRMLEAAAERTRSFHNVDLRQGALDALPLRDGEVHAATCLLVLHHVEAVDGALREAHRVLREEGRLVVVDMRAHDRRDWRHTMGHRHLGFDRAALVELARERGLDLVAWRDLPPAPEAQGPPLFLAVFGRNRE